MTPGILASDRAADVRVLDDAGVARAAESVAEEVRSTGRGALVRLVCAAPLSPALARELFRALGGLGRGLIAKLSLEAVEQTSLIEDAIEAGCVAIEIEREGALIPALASGISHPGAAFDHVVRALRRTRGIGVATVARLELGLEEDDEGVFERAVRFCRHALIAVPVLSPSTATRTMDRATLENGLRWARSRLTSHLAIWQRALWPSGTRRLTLVTGYTQRRELARTDGKGRYTPTMHLLHRLNRTARAHVKSGLLITLAGERGAIASTAIRSALLRTRAASDARVRALFIQVEGALDLRGARGLLERVRQALGAGYQRIVIDVHGLEAVSLEVLTRFIEENRTRFREVADQTRLVNLRAPLDKLRSRLDEIPNLSLLEAAAAVEV